ncbi:MAG: TonB-dependent receptor [bacterium]
MTRPSVGLIVLFILMTGQCFSQHICTGVITDCAPSSPLRGANIQVVGTETGMVTDQKGGFLLILGQEKKIKLSISYVGFETLIHTVLYQPMMDSMHVELCLKPQTQEMKEVFVTATRTPQQPAEIPARIATIPADVVMELPINNTDEVLQFLPGINIDRDFGIFSKNSSITMRGLNGSYRTLILMDGVPLNKTDGGGINWNRLVPDNIDRIEVLKGPVSAIYGSNAMSGVINIITERPTSLFYGEVKALYGTYNTFSGLLKLGGNLVKEHRGFYYSVSGFYRQGDGYIPEPDATRDSMDVPLYLKEGTVSGRLGYQFNAQNKLELEYNYYNDIRGDGTKIYEPRGGYNRYPTHYVRIGSQNRWGKSSLVVNGFYQLENYLRQSETKSVRRSGKYTLYETDSKRADYGLWVNLTTPLKFNQSLTFGMDLKQGSVNASDIYYTSSDILTNKGKMSFFAPFTEYELILLQGRLVLLGGLRVDFVWFTDGSFTIEDPSALTEFMTNYPTDFSDESWIAISPKLGLKYAFNPRQSLYFSYAHGFRPPILDDLCKNGNITKGFKLANPGLKPESLDNFEVGGDLTLFRLITLFPSLYLSLGSNFQYFVATGDSVYTGGDNLKPVLRRENISRVTILGGEISLTFPLVKNLSLTTNYAYNNSRITKFEPVGHTGKDLSGKFLMEVPQNQVFAGLIYLPRWLSASLIFRYVGKQWIDDENTAQTPGYWTLDLKVSHTFFHQMNLAFIVQDLLNRQWTDSKGLLSPGRFIMLSLSYSFSKLVNQKK